MRTNESTLILQTHLASNQLKISLHKNGATVHHFEDVFINLSDIQNLSAEVTAIINKSLEVGSRSNDHNTFLQKTGHALFEQLLTPCIKETLLKTSAENLQIVLDDQLAFIPWELLYDGDQYLCLKFNMGRSVQTARTPQSSAVREGKARMKMLVIADPCGSLPSARKEAAVIRDQLDAIGQAIEISTKTKEVSLNFVKKYIKDYDIIHFAGHTEYVKEQISRSGWKMKGGIFSITDIKSMHSGLPMPLLVFSNSCQSASEQPDVLNADVEDDVFGLANAFLLSGVRHFVGTLWKISDKEGVIFAQEFYKGLNQYESIGCALKRARIKARAQFGEQNMLWASYILYGDVTHTYRAMPRKFSAKTLKKHPVQVAVASFILIAILIMSGLFFGKKGYVYSDTLQDKRKVIKEKYLTDGKELTLNVLKHRLKDQSLKQQYINHMLMADVYALSNEYDLCVKSAEQVLMVANQLRDEDKIIQSTFYLADKIKEHGFYNIIFEKERGVSEQRYERAMRLYEKLVKQNENHSVSAYALKGIGDLYKLNGEKELLLKYYQQAIDRFQQKKMMNQSDYIYLLSMHIDMAKAYLDGDIDFEQAMNNLNAVSRLTKDPHYQRLSGADLSLLGGKYERLLQKVSHLGFKNSSFYEKAILIYRHL